MRLTLHVVAGSHAGQAFTFDEHATFVVGRHPRANLYLQSLDARDKRISRFHFMVEFNPPNCCLMDLGSKHGTFVNGRRVESSCDLKDGDKIEARPAGFRVELAPDPVATTADWDSVEEFEPIDEPSRPPQAEKPALPKITPEGWPRGLCLLCPTPLPPDGPWCCRGCVGLAEAADQPIPGYLLLAELGSGGMGVVHLARRESDSEAVAIKTVRSAVAGNPEHVRRFLREAEIHCKQEDPRIVAFHTMGEARGRPYFVMEYLAGLSAAERLKRNGPLPVKWVINVAKQLLWALQYAHKRGVVHRDVKPHNVLIGQKRGERTTVVKLADFGLARVYGESRLSGLTVLGQAGGTFGYMAPEQVTNFREARPTADQFAAAATIYHLLSGQLIHDKEENTNRMLAKLLDEDPVPLLTRRPDLPPELARVIHRALERDPARRYPDVGAFRRALAPFADQT